MMNFVWVSLSKALIHRLEFIWENLLGNNYLLLSFSGCCADFYSCSLGRAVEFLTTCLAACRLLFVISLGGGKRGRVTLKQELAFDTELIFQSCAFHQLL